MNYDSTIIEKLEILSDAAKYDVSCSSSGSNRRNVGAGIGNGHISGICHSFTPDGRCISLLKILLSNFCCYNCLYCPNRSGVETKRARFTPDEICSLVMNFYKRNYIEGLFLSSAIDETPEHTMELLCETVIKLRKDYGFNGYIHLKGIPTNDMTLIYKAAKYVDRMSFNIELPSEKSLKLLAPQKSKSTIVTPMRLLATKYIEEQKQSGKFNRIIPAGQTTQLIVGASNESDSKIIKLSEALYSHFRLKRVYYSSYIPLGSSSLLPSLPTPVLREHRLYQADWLLRFYGFSADELLAEGENFDLSLDPKTQWALRNYGLFPIEINTASYEALLKVPGIGRISAYRIMKARKYSKLNFEDLSRMRVTLKRAIHFITCNGKFGGIDSNIESIKKLVSSIDKNNEKQYYQLSMFSSNDILNTTINGEF